jgi:hypothetical protein
LNRAPEKILPAADVLRAYLRYDRRAGKLLWKTRPLSDFKLAAWGKYWNRRFAGKEAGSITDSRHFTVGLFGDTYKAHRIIFKMMTGKEPPQNLDHRDKNPSNNKWRNIRPATFAQNFVNRSVVWCKSGHSGIRESKCGHWEVRIHKDRKCIHLGTYKSKAKALAVRRKAEVELYGEFAQCA